MRTATEPMPPASSVTSPAIVATSLSHTYPARRRRRRGQPASVARPALDRVSLAIPARRITGILGPNGGGKSTLLRILATLMTPSHGGEVRVFDHDALADPAAVRRMLGVVFQHPALDGKLTVRENLTLHGRLYGLAHDTLRRDVPDWLARFGVAERIDDPAETLSGGQQRRVELAKAILHRPRLLLMDEPSTGLDPGMRRSLRQLLEDLREEQGMTIVLTTHFMDEAERCDRVAILAEGKVVADGAPDELKAAIGGQVIHVEADPSHEANSPAELATLIAQRFGPWDADGGGEPRVVDGRVRFEKRHGAAVVNSLVTALPARVRSVSVGQPTLEDVFLHQTGHTFSNGQADAEG